MKTLTTMRGSYKCSNVSTVLELQNQLMPQNNTKSFNSIVIKDIAVVLTAAMLFLMLPQPSKILWVGTIFLQLL